MIIDVNRVLDYVGLKLEALRKVNAVLEKYREVVKQARSCLPADIVGKMIDVLDMIDSYRIELRDNITDEIKQMISKKIIEKLLESGDGI